MDEHKYVIVMLRYACIDNGSQTDMYLTIKCLDHDIADCRDRIVQNQQPHRPAMYDKDTEQ